MATTSSEVRGLRPPLYAVLTLPGGLSQGFVIVTLGYVLTHHGFSVGQIATLVGLCLLPSTWRFVMGPLVDLSLSPARWTLVCAVLDASFAVGFAFVPLSPASMPLFAFLSLASGVSANTRGAATIAAMAQTSPQSERGAVSGWTQAGSLSGTGLGGGAGLWLATHGAGIEGPALALAALSLACAAPILWIRAPRRTGGESLAGKARGLAAGLWSFARTRTGVLTVLAVTLPAALNASGNLLPAVAGDWRASANLVAAVTGVLNGVLTLPGCVLGGYLCARLPPRTVYMAAALACAVGQFGMAVTPHTPASFAAFVLGNALLQGIAWGAVTAVSFEHLSPTMAATLGSVLGSFCNIPVVLMTMVVGRVQAGHGSTAMLLTEAVVAVGAVAAYALLARLWRPSRQGLAAGASLAPEAA